MLLREVEGSGEVLYCMISGGVFGRGGKGGGRSKCTRDIAYPEWQGGDMHCGHLDQYLDWRLMKLRSSDTILADPVVLVTLAPVNSLPRKNFKQTHVRAHDTSSSINNLQRREWSLEKFIKVNQGPQKR